MDSAEVTSYGYYILNVMRFNNPDKLLKLKFLGKHRNAIIKEYLKHKQKTGYVFVKADNHFHASDNPRFIERGFDEEMFLSIHEEEALKDEAAKNNEWVYYEVFWDTDKTSYHLKERL